LHLIAASLFLPHITAEDRAEWVKGSIEDWVMEGHRLAQTVAYRDLGGDNPAPITLAYERQADPVIEVQLEKAGVRLSPALALALQVVKQVLVEIGVRVLSRGATQARLLGPCEPYGSLTTGSLLHFLGHN
jgi:hypothetical protein